VFRRLLTFWADRSSLDQGGKTMRVMLLIKGDDYRPLSFP
jgi:hypothetical protein